MSRMNFFERMERKINFQLEYEKIEDILLNEKDGGTKSLNELIEEYFRNWKDRENFISFQELRNYMGFEVNKLRHGLYKPSRNDIQLNDFLLYSEMILNMFSCVIRGFDHDYKNIIKTITDTIQYDLEKCNLEIRHIKKNRIIIVQKNAATTAVVESVDADLADAIVQYNHHILKGNIEEKKIILKKIADALEPRRKELKSLNKTIESDFFYMVNNMNVRHNNCDPKDKGKYNSKFDLLTKYQQEEWYDEIYQEGLMAFLILEQVEREKKILSFKA